MNTNLQNQKIKKHRRLKFGALAIGISCAVIAMVVVINAVFTALAVRFRWYVDMTGNQLYGMTEQTHELLDGYSGTEEFVIKILFCSPEDELQENVYTNLVHSMAKEYEDAFNFVTVEYIDLINNPEAVNPYLGTSLSNPKTNSVIVTNGTQSRLLSLESFFTQSQETGDVIGFDGEYRFTLTILQLLGDSPIAYFVTGHGEGDTDASGNQTDVTQSVMWSLFQDAGYDVRTIDLSREDPDDAAKVMVIHNPRYDFMGTDDSVDEIAKLDRFLDNFGGLMVFVDATTPDLPELDTFLAEWGIAFEEKLIRDYSNSLASLDKQATELIAEYNSDTNKPGASLTNTLRAQANPPKAIVNYAKPISLLYDITTPELSGGTRHTGVVLQTSSDRTAEATPIGGGDATVEKGQFNLMTITVEQTVKEDMTHSSYVLAAGTASFAQDKYIGDKAYANRDIIFSAMKAFGKKTVPMDMDTKFFDKTELTISSGAANRLTVLFTAVLPAIAAGVGIVVHVRRRYL